MGTDKPVRYVLLSVSERIINLKRTNNRRNYK